MESVVIVVVVVVAATIRWFKSLFKKRAGRALARRPVPQAAPAPSAKAPPRREPVRRPVPQEAAAASNQVAPRKAPTRRKAPQATPAPSVKPVRRKKPTRRKAPQAAPAPSAKAPSREPARRAVPQEAPAPSSQISPRPPSRPPRAQPVAPSRGPVLADTPFPAALGADILAAHCHHRQSLRDRRRHHPGFPPHDPPQWSGRARVGSSGQTRRRLLVQTRLAGEERVDSGDCPAASTSRSKSRAPTNTAASLARSCTKTTTWANGSCARGMPSPPTVSSTNTSSARPVGRGVACGVMPRCTILGLGGTDRPLQIGQKRQRIFGNLRW